MAFCCVGVSQNAHVGVPFGYLISGLVGETAEANCCGVFTLGKLELYLTMSHTRSARENAHSVFTYLITVGFFEVWS